MAPGSTPRWVWIAVMPLALCVVGYVWTLQYAASVGGLFHFPFAFSPSLPLVSRPRKIQFLSERKKSGSSRDSSLAATSISGSGILYDLRSRRQGSGESSPCRERQPRHRK